MTAWTTLSAQAFSTASVTASESLEAKDLDTLGPMLGMTPAAARRFEVDTGVERIAHLRRTIVIGLLFYNLCNITDLILIRDTTAFGIILRLLVVTPVALVLRHVLGRVSAGLREALLFVAMIVVYGVPLLVFLWSSDPNAIYTIPNSFLIMVFAGMMLVLRFPYMVVFTAVALLCTFGALCVKSGLPSALLLALVAQSVTGCAFVLYGNHRGELTQRRSYLRALREILRSDDLQADKTWLASLSSTDPLTGVANRRALDERVAAILGDRRSFPVGLLMIDVDHFKRFNDTYGHLAGDRCLRVVAEVMARPLRAKSDLLARYGGEEFAVLLPGVDQAVAAHVAERIRIAVEGLALTHAGRLDGTAIVTVSIGIAAADRDVSADVLFAEADAALYGAKRLGRNRCATGAWPTAEPAPSASAA